MAAPVEPRQKASLSDYLAVERTLLAWIRTGLALMGFGFVVARFGLFLERLQVMQSATPEQSYGLSLWFGTALILAGIIVNAFAGWHHIRLVRRLDSGETTHSRASIQAVAIAFFLALAGLVMAIYLISVRGSTRSQIGDRKEIPRMLNNKGIIDRPSNHSVNQTIERIKRILEAKGATLFALDDESYDFIDEWRGPTLLCRLRGCQRRCSRGGPPCRRYRQARHRRRSDRIRGSPRRRLDTLRDSPTV